MRFRGAAGVVTASIVVCALGCAGRKQAEQSTSAPPIARDVLAPGTHEFTVSTPDGLERLYLVHVPKTKDPSAPKPVLFVLHGGGGSARGTMEIMGWNTTADAHGFVAVYPQGVVSPKGSAKRPFATWHVTPDCCGEALARKTYDVSFVRLVLSEVSKKLPVDSKRVHATGLSNGGLMSYKLGCEAADAFAAIAPVGAPGADWSACTPPRPVPVMHVHGALDKCAEYGGGMCGGCFQRALGEMFNREVDPKEWACAPIEDALAPWKTRAKVEGKGSITLTRAEATCTTWAGGAAEIALCVDRALGHEWPSGGLIPACEKRPDGRMCEIWMDTVGPASDTLNNDDIWAFLSKHALP